MGARPEQDGVDYIETDITNMMNAPTEAVEMEYPLRIHSMRLLTDSGGAGRTRGGLGMRKVIEVTEGVSEVTHRGDRHFTSPWGMNGGLPAMSWSSIVRRSDGSEHKVPARERFKMQQGDIIDCITAGGGGYGDPLLRAPADVREDVLDQRVSLEAAQRHYGVVLDERLAIDAASSARRREAMKAARGPITWTFDRGELGRS
jgi:N-methylhydantoinase B